MKKEIIIKGLTDNVNMLDMELDYTKQELEKYIIYLYELENKYNKVLKEKEELILENCSLHSSMLGLKEKIDKLIQSNY